MTDTFGEIGYRAHEAPSSGQPPSSGPSGHLLPVNGAKEEGCAVPDCADVPPKGCVFCTQHHFALPPAWSRAIIRARIACERAEGEVRGAAAKRTYAAQLAVCLNHFQGRLKGASR